VTLGLAARSASAYDASLVWLPVAGAHGYKIYVSQSGEPDTTGMDVGAQAPGADGLIRYPVPGLPLDSTSYFWVTSYNLNDVESEFSNDLSLSASTVPPGSGGTPTPNNQPSTPTPTATATPNTLRALKLTLSGYFYKRPTRHITFVARYQYAKGPIVVTLIPPSNLSVTGMFPATADVGTNMIVWPSIQRSYGKVRITFAVSDQVQSGSVFSASATLQNSRGLVATSSAAVSVSSAAAAPNP